MTTWFVPLLVLLAVVATALIFEFGLKRRLDHRHDGDMDAAMADNSDPIPGTHLVEDDETPLGDTKEAHDELSPHDLPFDHPGRLKAEREARFERASSPRA